MKGIIYRIVGISHPEIQYVGSTMNELRYRWRGHKSLFKLWVSDKDKYKKCAIYPYFELYGVADFTIIKIKEYNICDKKHLSAYEQLWMNKIKCVNNNNALGGYTCKFFQKYEESKNYSENKEAALNYMKHYYQNNKEAVLKYHRRHYQKNKNMILANGRVPIICECGREVRRDGLTEHKKSAQHKLFETDGVSRYLPVLNLQLATNSHYITTEAANLNIIN